MVLAFYTLERQVRMTLTEWKRQNREELRIAREKARLERKAREAYAATETKIFFGLVAALFIYALVTYSQLFPIL